MTDIRELLELAARAMRLRDASTVEAYTGDWIICHTGQSLSPHTDSGHCADMCAALGIDTEWCRPIRPPREITSVACVSVSEYAMEYMKDHNNDRSAAWRMAALRVAAEIGRAKG